MDVIKEISSLDVFKDDDEALGGGAVGFAISSFFLHFVEFDDVLVVELLDEFELVLENGEIGGFFVEFFDGELLGALGGEEDVGVVTAADGFDDPVLLV